MRFSPGPQRTALPLALCVAALASCTESPRIKEEPGAKQCISTMQFFTDEVWNAFMSSTCYACHNAQGIAADTDLVLQSPNQAGFLDANFEIVSHMAANERDGVSFLLLKPVGELDHGGGKVIDKDGEEYQALESLIEQLREPVVCSDTGGEAFAHVELLDAPRTLRKATLAIAGRLPTPDELAQVQGGDAEDLDAAIDNLLLEEAFYTRLKNIYGDLFLTDKYFPNTRGIDLLDDDIFPSRTWYDAEFPPAEERTDEQDAEYDRVRRASNRGVARDPLELLAHVARNDRPWTEIVTADYMMVNPYSARVYGVEGQVTFTDPTNENEFQEARLPSYPHAGIITSPMWLNRFPTTDTNRNRHRARMVYKFFLATDVLKLADRPLSSEAVDAINPTRNHESCNVCHNVIDPIAGLLQKFDAQGRYVPDAPWHEEMIEPGYGEDTLPPSGYATASQFLGERLAADPLFALSTVHTIYKGVTGRDPVTAPSDPDDPAFEAKSRAYFAQDEVFQRIAEKFAESEFNIRTVAKEILLSPYFRAAGVSKDVSAAEVPFYESLGTGRFLTPELLSTKINAVLGYPWTRTYDDRELLLESGDGYLIYFGGIDYDGVTSRITDPNGLMAAVASRMAFEMSCRTTARDLAKPAEQRILFPLVETSYEPEDENGFVIPAAEAAIRENIVYLFERVLAEERHPEDEEVLAAYDLWLQTWREGKERVIADSESEYLPGRCRATNDYVTDAPLPEEERLERDDDYTVRAWMAVMAYLLSDAKFLHE